MKIGNFLFPECAVTGYNCDFTRLFASIRGTAVPNSPRVNA